LQLQNLKSLQIRYFHIVAAAVQGAWSAVIQKPVEQEMYLEMAFGRVKNTCWVWREDGPLMAKYKSMTETTGS